MTCNQSEIEPDQHCWLEKPFLLHFIIRMFKIHYTIGCLTSLFFYSFEYAYINKSSSQPINLL
jgi:hypothetical protein